MAEENIWVAPLVDRRKEEISERTREMLRDVRFVSVCLCKLT